MGVLMILIMAMPARRCPAYGENDGGGHSPIAEPDPGHGDPTTDLGILSSFVLDRLVRLDARSRSSSRRCDSYNQMFGWVIAGEATESGRVRSNAANFWGRPCLSPHTAQPHWQGLKRPPAHFLQDPD